MLRISRQRAIVAALAAGGLPLLAGCSSPLSPQPTPTNSSALGIIEGTTSLCYGPVVPPRNAKAPVDLKDAAGSQVAHLDVGTPYEFRFTVNAGRYVVSGAGARSVSVSVSRGKTMHVTLLVVCI